MPSWACTYPPDTILASKQAKEIGFNPAVFFTAVGTAFQLYKNVMGADAEGVIGHGLVERRRPARPPSAYFEAHVKKFQKEPDRWASGPLLGRACRSCRQAVEKVGVDRKAIRDYIAEQRARDDPRPDALQGSENVLDSRHRQPVAAAATSRWSGRRPRHRAELIAPKPAWKYECDSAAGSS